MRPWAVVVVALLLAACGGSETSAGIVADAGGTADSGGVLDATSSYDATADVSGDTAATACTPGRSVACVGPGGCSSNQVCNGDGSGYGLCDCVPVEAGPLCVPGQSVACVGPGGCVSNQVCNAQGTAYGPCDCPASFDARPPSECQTATDCENLLGPLPVMCLDSCPPGSPAEAGVEGYCWHYVCILGTCQTTYCG